MPVCPVVNPVAASVVLLPLQTVALLGIVPALGVPAHGVGGV